MIPENTEQICLNALESLRKKLLDLTRRNKLLNFRETKYTIRIIDELPNQIFDILVNDFKGMTFLSLPENVEKENKKGDEGKNKEEVSEVSTENELPFPKGTVPQKHKDLFLQTPYSPESLERRSKKLLQQYKTAIEETGSNFLYLALGFLEWYESNDSEELIKAPLILLPVSLERKEFDQKTNCYSYILSYTEEDIETNFSLTQKLSKDFDLILPSIPENLVPEDYFDEISNLVRNKPRWKVARESFVGLFSFAKILIWKDLDPKNWPSGSKIHTNPNIKNILVGNESVSTGGDINFGEEYPIDEIPGIENIPLVLDADSSQHSAVLDVLKGNSLVIEGPPGTGKSQTIANIIVASLYEGKSVLFVSEKRAALEVVRKRLNDVGLGDFCLELHSHKSQKKELFGDLEKRLKRKQESTEKIDQDIEDLIAERNKLKEYADLVNKTFGSSNKTIFEILWGVERWGSEISGEKENYLITNSLNLERQDINIRVAKLEDLARLRKDITLKTIKFWNWFNAENILPGDKETIEQILIGIFEETKSYLDFRKEMERSFEFPFNLGLSFIQKLGEANEVVFNEIPNYFDKRVASACLNPNAIELLNELNSQIIEYQNKQKISEIFDKDESSDSILLIKQIQEVALQLDGLGFGDQKISGIKNLIKECSSYQKGVESLFSIFKVLKKLNISPPGTTSDCEHTLKILNLIINAPENLNINGTSFHAFPTSQNAFLKAKDEAGHLLNQLRRDSRFFEIDRIPPHEQLTELIQVWKNYEGKMLSFFSSRKRKAKNKIKEFLIDPKDIKIPDLIPSLENLANLLKNIEDFKNNQNYIKILGSSYKGIKTDWKNLEGLIDWSKTFASIIGSQKITSQVIISISTIRGQVEDISERIKKTVNTLLSATKVLNLETNEELNIRKTNEEIKQLKNNFEIALKLFSSTFNQDDISLKEIIISSKAWFSKNSAKKIIEENQRIKFLFPDFFNGVNTDTKRLLEIAVWIKNLEDKSKFPKEIVEWLIDDDIHQRMEALSEVIQNSKSYLHEIDNYFSELSKYGQCQFSDFIGSDNLSIERAIEKLQNSKDEIEFLPLWSDYFRTAQEAKRMGLANIISSLENETIKPEDACSQFLYALHLSMARDVINTYPQLASFNRASHENSTERFLKLDRKIIDNNNRKIANKILKNPCPRGISFGYVKNFTELSLIKHEIGKKKKHLKIRELVKRAGNALKALKPCFMMGPLSVSQYLEPGYITFDLLVMDEASQIRPEDSLGSIARAKQMVVVGDSKQLPPTSFFDRINESNEEQEVAAIEDIESILDISREFFNVRRLLWHYRSDHESLIAFSNTEFYDDSLVIFPSPYYQRDDLGVSKKFIKGEYKKGRNRLEAEAIAKAVSQHFKFQNNRSLGVVAVNKEQSDLIQDIIYSIRKKDSELDKKIKQSEETMEEFFVKNLENVQGDERDTIFISTTYGPDRDTQRVYQRFGPIGGSTGDRRLNVLFTRARKQIKVFTSLRPSDIHITSQSQAGPRVFRAYLEFAEHGRIPDFGSKTEKGPDSDFEIAVVRVLNQCGYKTVPQVGVEGFYIDIGVLHPNRENEYILGIECDGAKYHSARSVRDRDRLRQEILESKLWKIHRIWSTDWFKNRENEINRLLRRIEEILKSTSIDIVSGHNIDNEAFPTNKFENEELDEENSETLREKLIQFRTEVIEKSFHDPLNCILREEMLDLFVTRKPLNHEEFLERIPLRLRAKTDGHQTKFLPDILNILKEFS